MQRKLLNLILVITSISTYAQSSSIRKIPPGLPADISYGILDNGFTYYILKKQTAKKNIYISLVDKVGLYNFDDPAQLGLAHFIEHLAFQSTTNFPNGIKKELKSLGLQSGADFGATTGESTNYWVDVPSGDSILLGRALLAAYDWAGGRLFLPDQVEEERAAVKNEMERGNNPSFRHLMQLPYLLFDKNPLYAPRFTSEFKNIDTTSILRLREFENKWYRPDLQAIIIVGDIDGTILQKQVIDLFSKLSPKNATRPLLPGHEKYQVKLNGKSKVFVLNHGQKGTAFTIMQKRKSSSPSSYTIQSKKYEKLVDELYNELAKTRLVKASKNHKLNYSTLIHYINRDAIHGLASIDALTTKVEAPDLKLANEVFRYANIELRRIELWGFTSNELIAAKQSVRKRNLKSLKSQSLEMINNAFLDNFITGAPVAFSTLNEYDSLVASIDLKDVNNMAKKWLAETGDVDIKVELPNEENINKFDKDRLLNVFHEARSKKLKPYSENILQSPFLSSIPDTSHYVLTNFPEIKGITLKLGNGATVIIKKIGEAPFDYERGKEIDILGFSKNGTYAYDDDDKVSAWLAPVPVINAGVGALGKKDLSDWISQKNANGALHIIPYVEESIAGIKGEASLNNIEDLFKLVYLYFTQPRKDKRAFLEHKRNTTVLLNKRSLEDSISIVADAYLGRTEKLKSIENAKFNRSTEIYKQMFSNASDFTFIIAGYFETDSIIKLARKYLGALPAGQPKIKIAKEVEKINNREYELRTTIIDDSAGNVNIRLLFPGRGAKEIKDQLELQVLGKIIEVKLAERLRTKEKLVYYANANIEINKDNGLFLLNVGFETLPTDADRAISYVIDELSTLATKGFEEGLLISAKRSVQNAFNSELITSSHWTSAIAFALQRGEPLEDIPEDEKLVENITKADIIIAAQKFLNTKYYSVFKLL